MDEKPNVAPLAQAKDPPQPKGDPMPAKKLSADELVKKHLDEVSKLKPEDHPDTHRLVSELVEDLPTWQRRVVIARFHSHGMHIHSRLHPDVFKVALDEALNGKV